MNARMYVDDKRGMAIMKTVKGIGLFLIYPLLMLGIGFYTGVKAAPFFEPEETTREEQQILEPLPLQDELNDYDVVSEEDASEEMSSTEVAAAGATLCVDTKYVLEEADILNHTVTETSVRLPDKYIGMDREQFLQAMETYEISPPLSEQERGFVDLEVISFSRERVVVRKNYRFLQPSSSFYLAVYDNEVIVYLEDRETVYIETHIRLDSLPEQLQEQIIEMMWVEDEEKLYSFLENYSS